VASVIKNVSFDAADALALAAFWAAAPAADLRAKGPPPGYARIPAMLTCWPGRRPQVGSRGYGYCGARCWKARMPGFWIMPSRISMARRMTWSQSQAPGPSSTVCR
jgi:hypothetical protein